MQSTLSAVKPGPSAWMLRGAPLAICALLAACGSQAQQDRNNAAMDEQIAAANASIAADARRKADLSAAGENQAEQAADGNAAAPAHP